MKNLSSKKYDEGTFESIKHIDENGGEFWYARELMKLIIPLERTLEK